ncbi:MAG: alpha/beta hydrolase, partial [Devosia sp.]
MTIQATGNYHFAEVVAAPGSPLLLLFHGTGGNENDLIDLGRQLMPEAHLIAPRGDVSEGGALRFFRRTGEGVYDMADFARATAKMTQFVAQQAERLEPSSVAALGYSNGANILASVLFDAPGRIDRAVLMHP